MRRTFSTSPHLLHCVWVVPANFGRWIPDPAQINRDF
jgi:hypothetical protein